MTISNRNIVEKQPVVLDPSFFLPPDVVDVRYINDQDTAGIYAEPSGDPTSEGDDAVVVVDGPSPINDVISAPSLMTVLSQTVRIAPDGRFVVDVEIEVEDVPGVANFEVRLTKA